MKRNEFIKSIFGGLFAALFIPFLPKAQAKTEVPKSKKDQWRHFSIRMDGSGTVLYVNGKQMFHTTKKGDALDFWFHPGKLDAKEVEDTNTAKANSRGN